MDPEAPEDDELDQATWWADDFYRFICFIDPETGWLMGTTQQPDGRDLWLYRNPKPIEVLNIDRNYL